MRHAFESEFVGKSKQKQQIHGEEWKTSEGRNKTRKIKRKQGISTGHRKIKEIYGS